MSGPEEAWSGVSQEWESRFLTAVTLFGLLADFTSSWGACRNLPC